jgi:hypothetical protein
MPQLVRDARYFSHCEHGVEMGESISLSGQLVALEESNQNTYQCPPFTLW